MSETAPSGKALLWIDDEPHSLSCERLLLEKSGVHVEWATTIAEATERLNSKRYDLIILDCMLPPDSPSEEPIRAGVTFLDRLRSGKIGASCDNRKLKVIVVTAIGSMHILETLRKAEGVERIMMKPIATREMHEAIMESLGRSEIGTGITTGSTRRHTRRA